LTVNLRELRARLDRLTGHVPTTPEGPLVPTIPVDRGPPPRGTRYMKSEEVLREVERSLRGEPSPHVLTPAQQAEIDARFEATTGGVENVERLQRELLAAYAQDASTEWGNGEAPGVSP
jgi:hypothetical protein